MEDQAIFIDTQTKTLLREAMAIVRRTGCKDSEACQIVGLDGWQTLENATGEVTDYVPTPAEIQEACRTIQEAWTDEEWNRRGSCRPQPAETPTITMDALVGKR